MRCTFRITSYNVCYTKLLRTNPELIYKFNINSQTGLLDFQARNIAMKLFKDVKLARKAADIFQKLYQIFLRNNFV